MFKSLLISLCLLIGLCGSAQNKKTNYQIKTFAVRDTVYIDSVSINPNRFSIKTLNHRLLDTSAYTINFSKAQVIFKKPILSDSIIIAYLKFPDFLTKTYKQLDARKIISSTAASEKRYKLTHSNKKKSFVPFDGLNTSGSISRGVTIGNIQNSVLNSELDLKITGKLNDNITLRAAIKDTNIPLQEDGYSQRLDEFDQVFIELFSEQWHLRGGDIDLQNTDSYFAQFSKRVQGLSLKSKFGNDDASTEIFAAGALVRGQFSRSQFTAQEGNQGPYKLEGNRGELYVLIVVGSESVYVNGRLLKRGKDQDYTIDYNAGEIRFNPTFPITSEMRITVDYQFSDRNYSRLIAYGGGTHSHKNFKVGLSIYSESDAKNQPLQQNLSTTQIEALQAAGDNKARMVAPSAIKEPFTNNRILYKKERVNGDDIFVFSKVPEENLYRVRFSLVGTQQGAYKRRDVLDETSNGDSERNELSAINPIYEFVGNGNGSYAPISQLVAPTGRQVAVINAVYAPNENTDVRLEVSGSKTDLNLFSDLDDDNNNGFAAHLKMRQTLLKKPEAWHVDAFLETNFIDANYSPLERLYNPEFNRDWNLNQNLDNSGLELSGSQKLAYTGLQAAHPKWGQLRYQFEHLNLSQGFNGNRHVGLANLNLKHLSIRSSASLLSTQSQETESHFLRLSNSIKYLFKKTWAGAAFALEKNKEQNRATKKITPYSQNFKTYELFVGLGDSTRVFAELGYKNRVNDSLREERLKRVNQSHTIYLKSKLIQNKNTHLALFANYRKLINETPAGVAIQTLNGRLQYHQKLFKRIIQWHTLFETNSGTLPRQDFTYVEVNPGQGAYTWIDYNANDIQELEEFEVAQFQDQGRYVRVLLPNRVFLKTHQNRLTQTLTINPAQSGQDSFWKHFYSQTSYLIDRENQRKSGAFNLNPFDADEDRTLGMQLNFKNVLFFNRGKQHYTSSYTYQSNESRRSLSLGILANYLKQHSFDFNHKLTPNWLVSAHAIVDSNRNESENFKSKNYLLKGHLLSPKLSYLFNQDARLEVFYKYKKKQNYMTSSESLKQQNYGVSFRFSRGKKGTISGALNYFSNEFSGVASTPVAYQMLEGLQPGKNITWQVLIQKKLISFLDVNFSYFGRSSQTSTTVHTGNVTLKASF